MWGAVSGLVAGVGERFLEIAQGPPPSNETNAVPYVIILIIGFIVGGYGHVGKNRWLIAAGIALIILAIVLFQIEIITEEPDYVPPGV